MTVSTIDIVSGPYLGNDVTTQFSYDFRVDDKSQLTVYETDDQGAVTTLVVDTNYTVNNVGTDGGGTIDRLAGALPTGYTWYIRANYQKVQLTDFESQGGFFPDVHEKAFDILTFISQQQQDQIDRALRFADSYSGNATVQLPTPEADKVLVWANDGLSIVNGPSEGTFAGYASAAAASAAAALASQNAAALSESNASTSESNASTSESNAAASAAAALASQNAASTSESNASTSESNASTSESNASTSESNASTSASNASTSETNAAASAAAASAAVSSVSAEFDTVAAMVTDTSITVGSFVRTRGYIAKGDGGANVYEIVAAGTGTVDGGVYIDLTGISGQANGLFVDGTRNVKQFGATGDGVTDDTTAIQAAIDAAGNTVVQFPEAEYVVSTITLAEGAYIKGQGQANLDTGNPDGGTWLLSTTIGNVIDIDGEFVGFDSRRSITINGINIQSATAARIIDCDFLTRFEFSDMMLSGAATYGIYMENSYNGILSRVMCDGQGTGLYATIKTSPNDVFSGQLLFEDCDFWNATTDGCKIEASDNVMAQLQFNKCHFKTNATGFSFTGANVHTPTFTSCHFEENSTNDVFVDSAVLHAPAFIGCHFNNTNAVKKINCEGDELFVEKCEFIAGDGIRLNGANANVRENAFRNLTTAITIAASATNSLIGRASYTTVTTNISDSGTDIQYEGEINLISSDINLNVASDEYFFQANNDWYIAVAELLIQSNTNAGATASTIDGGIDGNTTKYFSRNGPTQSKGARVNVPLTLNKIDSGDIVRIGLTANSSTGDVKCRLRLVPFEI